MEINSQTVSHVEFRAVRKGGYSQDDVRAFLEEVATKMAELENAVHSPPSAPEPDPVVETTQPVVGVGSEAAGQHAFEIVSRARVQAAEILTEASEDAARVYADQLADNSKKLAATTTRLAEVSAEVSSLETSRDVLDRETQELSVRLEALRNAKAEVLNGLPQLAAALSDAVEKMEAVTPEATLRTEETSVEEVGTNGFSGFGSHAQDGVEDVDAVDKEENPYG